MKKSIILFAVILGVVACSKTKEQLTQNYIDNLVTNSRWKVGTWTDSSGVVNIRQWSGYSFQFYNNDTVETYRNNILYVKGTWGSNISDTTLWAQFPSTINDTLKKLNGTWKWTSGTTTYINVTHKVHKARLHLIQQ